ncbi:MAG TPA: hypothetical protein VM577_07860 [Anaerovoracaceae bacterium]|nr:hypothetical protein [Anaerovoracaceae bacterium]
MNNIKRFQFEPNKPYKADALCFEIFHALKDKGIYYFTPNKFLDSFQLDDDVPRRMDAINKALTFNKRLDALECEWAALGIEMVDRQALIFNFTYQVQSKRFDNKPLKVDRHFQFNSVPVQFMPFMFADTWIQAYEAVPWDEVEEIAAGK